MNKELTATELITHLELEPLPHEGGYFRQTFKSSLMLEVQSREGDPPSSRSASTLIFYLVTPESFSTLHRIRHDEVFHFYLGDPVESLSFSSELDCDRVRMGSDLIKGDALQRPIQRGRWQGLKLCPGGQWALLGCSVAPGFEFEDFEAGRRSQLLKDYPRLKDAILEFTLGDASGSS
ncbi:MAG: cupin domain-containing protein [Bradymonadales bacterium]|nr:MAG: cupin domain-containing protein [Bradymonadales bacterium]